MGNEQPKKIPRINKSQVQMAALKAKIHLELMRDRKTQQIIKGEKELVAKLNAKSRNHTEQSLIMERVVNGLKYTQAVNQLIAYATSLRSQAGFLCQNVGNQQKLEPWLTQVHSLLFAADQLGLSSLNEFKGAMRALNDPLIADKFVNPEIKQMLSPTPTFYEVNIYVLEMCQRNQIDLEVINSAGHKFSNDPQPPNQERKSFTDIEKQLASKFQKQLNNNQGNQGNQNNQNNQGFNSGNGGWGNQGGFGGNQIGFNGNNGGFGGNQGGFNGGFNGNTGNFGGQGFNPNQTPNQTPVYYDNPVKTNNYDSNPYKGASNIREGPTYYTPSQIQQNQNQQKPSEFSSFDDINLRDTRKTVDPIYPSVNPNVYQNQTYTPQNFGGNGGYGNENSNGNGSGSGNGNAHISGETKSPTISQIMRDFDLK